MSSSSPPLRVLQLDALRLDAELVKLIYPGWAHVVRFWTANGGGLSGGRGSGSGGVSEEFSQWLLHATVAAMTVLAGQPQPGAAMLGLKYKEMLWRDSTTSAAQSLRPTSEVWRRRLTYFFISVVVPGLFKFVIMKKLRERSAELESQFSELSRRREDLLFETSLLPRARQEQSHRESSENSCDENSRDGDDVIRTENDKTMDNYRVIQNQQAAQIELRAVSRKKLAVALLLGADVVFEALTKGAELINTLVFIGSSNADDRSAGYRSLADRISGMTMEYGHANSHNDGSSRILSFDYLNQQLVFRELSDLFEVLAPFAVNTARAISNIVIAARVDGGGMFTPKLLKQKKGRNDEGLDHDNDKGVPKDENALKQHINDINVENVVCCRCESIGTHSPYMVMPCMHHFCYYCIAQHIVNNSNTGTDSMLASQINSTARLTGGMQRVRCLVCLKKIETIVPIRKRVLN